MESLKDVKKYPLMVLFFIFLVSLEERKKDSNLLNIPILNKFES